MKHRSLKLTAFFLSLVFVFSLFPNVFSFAASASKADMTTLIIDKKVISILQVLPIHTTM